MRRDRCRFRRRSAYRRLHRCSAGLEDRDPGENCPIRWHLRLLGAAIWLAGTSVQDRAGVAESPEKARTYLRALLGDDQLERQEAFVDTAPAVVELLEKDPNIEFEWRPFPDYYKLPGRMDSGRAINPVDLPIDRAGGAQQQETLIGGRALIGRLLLALEGSGHAILHTNTSARSLIVDGKRVVGVHATNLHGETLRIKAKYGVLLAAGGIEGNNEMRSANNTPGKTQWSMGPQGANTGDLITAAVEIGAGNGPARRSLVVPGGGNSRRPWSFHGWTPGRHHRRRARRTHLNESLPYDQFGRAMIARDKATPTIPSYLVFDSREGEGILPAISVPEATAAEHLAAGTWIQADTIDALATAIGVPTANLSATIARFNDFAKRGNDEDFTRGEDPYDLFFCPPSVSDDAPNPALHAISQGPFYAARIVLSDLGTKGGLRTDTDGRVLRADGSNIEGLYAAGNTAASLSGRHYPGPGVPLGTAMVFSYRAVEHMTS